MKNQPIPKKIVTDKSTISTDFRFIHRITWSPDSQYFAVTQTTRTTVSVIVYDAKTHRIVKDLSVEKCGPYPGDQEFISEGDVAFSPDGRYLAGGVGIITLWDTKTWQPVRNILGPFSRGSNAAAAVRNIAFSPDSRSLAIFYRSVTWPETVRVDGIEGARAIAKDKSMKHTHPGTIMAFDVETANRLFVIKEVDTTLELGETFTANLAYTPNGQYLLTARREHHKLTPGEHYKFYPFLDFRDPSTGNIVKEINDVHVMQIEALTSSPNGNYVATGTNTLSRESKLNEFTNEWDVINNQDPIRLWDIASGNKVKEFGPLRGAVVALMFTPDNRVLISCQTDLANKETIWLWDIESGQLIERVSTPKSGSNFFSCAISPDGHTIAMPVEDKIYLVNIQQ